MRLTTFSDIKLTPNQTEKDLLRIIQKKFKKPIKFFQIKKKSIDARNKQDVRIVYTVEVSDCIQTVERQELERLPKEKLPPNRVLVVGCGPAGLFCALRLLDRGIAPILVDRGANVDERAKDVQTFITTKQLNPQSNIQFGEGGAGTFSDGKLNTQTHSPLNRQVLETFVKYGAPEEILWLNKPHIGSDKLRHVVKNMREYIIRAGGEVRFHTCLTDICVRDGALQSVTLTNTQNGLEETLEPAAVVLAVGHSARDTFSLLYRRGVTMTAKDFAVGVRIEHLQKHISFSQYGQAHTLLPAADYKLVSHVGDLAAFTFCMCPGGYVMPATSEEGMVVTNGMSNYARDGENANAALIVQVRKTSFGDVQQNPLLGIEYQRGIERKAYLAGGGAYYAPVQRVEDFLKDKCSSAFGEVKPTYSIGTAFSDFRAVLPADVVQTLKLAIVDMDKRLKGFAHADALLTAAETRTSSPIRIERDATDCQSVSVKNLYPCGEGAGYAGGITSSAADGIRIADAVFSRFYA